MSSVHTLKSIQKLRGMSTQRKRHEDSTDATFVHTFRPQSLVDPDWETIDPNPDIHALFQQYNDAFFSGKLAACELKWSPRMTLCAGICSFEGHGGLCSIRLSVPLLKFRPRKDLVETLLHEMIHAYLFLTEKVTDRNGHGPNFQYHMHRINTKAGTNITIYHNFTDEVKFYQQHWWRCNGPCRLRPPFYGWVKRAMNRAPGINDYWWDEHQKSCNGNFIKVKEPEGYGAKKGGPRKVSGGKRQKVQTSLDLFFPGKGYVLGHSSSLSNGGRLDDHNGVNEVEPPNLRCSQFNNCEDDKTGTAVGASNDTSNAASTVSSMSCQMQSAEKYFETRTFPQVEQGSSSSKLLSSLTSVEDITVLVPCPVCCVLVPENNINSHLDSCLL